MAMWAPSCPWPVTMALAMALGGATARADWVSDPAAGVPALGVAASGVLDRALQVDPQAQQRNLGVLLEARQAPDGNALLQRRPDGTLARRPVLPQDIEAVQTPGVPPAPPMLGLRANEEERAAATLSRREWQATGPGGSAGGAAYGAGAGGGPNSDGPSGAPRGRPSEELQGIRLALYEVEQFVREHRFPLLGGMVLLALLLAGAQGFMRRR
jgi:hypothetical protein